VENTATNLATQMHRVCGRYILIF